MVGAKRPYICFVLNVHDRNSYWFNIFLNQLNLKMYY